MGPAEKLLDGLRLLRRVEAIFDRYCREGKRPSKDETADWLRFLGWQPTPLANLLKKWGYS